METCKDKYDISIDNEKLKQVQEQLGSRKIR